MARLKFIGLITLQGTGHIGHRTGQIGDRRVQTLCFWAVFNSCKFVPAGKILGHREPEVHTVYQRLQATPKDISGYCACLYQTRCVAKLSE